MKWFALGVLALVAVSAFGQNQVPAPIRIPVRHADPWAIKAMLEGQAIMMPELGTLMQLGGPIGQGAAAGQAAGAAFLRNGRLVVNPTDNSLWFFPDRVSG